MTPPTPLAAARACHRAALHLPVDCAASDDAYPPPRPTPKDRSLRRSLKTGRRSTTPSMALHPRTGLPLVLGLSYRPHPTRRCPPPTQRHSLQHAPTSLCYPHPVGVFALAQPQSVWATRWDSQATRPTIPARPCSHKAMPPLHHLAHTAASLCAQ